MEQDLLGVPHGSIVWPVLFIILQIFLNNFNGYKLSTSSMYVGHRKPNRQPTTWIHDIKVDEPWIN